MLGEQSYYVQKALSGERVVLEVDADTGELVVWHRKVPIKRLELKGLKNMPLAFDDFVDQLRKAGAPSVAPDTGGTPRQMEGKLGECMASVQGGNGYEVGKSAGAAGAKPYTR